MRLLKSHLLLKMVNSYVIDLPQSYNINYFCNFGYLLAFCLRIQITQKMFRAKKGGASLAPHYNPSIL